MMRSLIVVIACSLSLHAAAQEGVSEMQLRLDLKRAELNERVAADGAARTKQLFDRGLASAAELSAAEADLQRAAVETQKARVSLLSELPSFRVLSAVKSVRANGDVWVDLRLQELDRLAGERMRRTYLVSLKGEHSIISEPYQRHVTLDGHGGALSLPFRLLKDADEVTVLLVSGTRREEIPILLQRSRADHLVVACPNFSQQGALGEHVDYTLQLDRFSTGMQTVRVNVAGLPAGFHAELIDAGTRAKLTLVRFAPDQNTIRVVARVHVPAQGETPWLDRPLPFHIEVAPEQGATTLGRIDLQLRPVGWPKLALVSDNLLVQMGAGERKTIEVTVENTGGAAARDIVFDLAAPIGFRADAAPRALPLLGPGEKRVVALQLSTEPDAVPGDYTLKVRARSRDHGATIESPEQSFRIGIERGGGAYWLALSFGVLAVIGVGAAKKLNRG